MINPPTVPIACIVMGTSMGGFEALKKILAPLPVDFPVPVLVVRHQAANSCDYIINSLNDACQLKFKYAEQGDHPRPGTVYLAPPDRHLLINKTGHLQLSEHERVNFSRPAIDPLFKSVAQVYAAGVLAVQN